jgi:hypothetical protein
MKGVTSLSQRQAYGTSALVCCAPCVMSSSVVGCRNRCMIQLACMLPHFDDQAWPLGQVGGGGGRAC